MLSSFRLAVLLRILSTASSLIVGLATLRLYARHLSPSSYGVVLIAIQILSYLPVIGIGFITPVNQRLLSSSDITERERLLTFAEGFNTWLGVLVALISTLGIGLYSLTGIAQQSGQTLAFFLSLGLITGIGFFISNQMMLLIGLKAQSLVFLIGSLQSWATLAGLWAGFELNLGLWAFPFSSATSTATMWLLTWVAIKRIQPAYRFVHFRTPTDFWQWFNRLKIDGLACVRTQAAITLLFTIDLVIVGTVCGAYEAAVYGVLSRLFAVLRSVLQSLSEASWPIIAQRSQQESNLGQPLLYLNAWMFGAAIGALALTLIPLTRWYMGREWTAAPLVVWLMLARNLVSGLWSAAGYYLLGVGRFTTLCRYVERELIAGTVLAIPLGHFFKLNGVAAAFLVSTGFGTLFPLFRIYARQVNTSPMKLLVKVWSRALAGVLVSLLIAFLLLPGFQQSWRPAVVVIVSAAGGLISGLTWSFLRGLARKSETGGTLSLRQIITQC